MLAPVFFHLLFVDIIAECYLHLVGHRAEVDIHVDALRLLFLLAYDFVFAIEKLVEWEDHQPLTTLF